MFNSLTDQSKGRIISGYIAIIVSHFPYLLFAELGTLLFLAQVIYVPLGFLVGYILDIPFRRLKFKVSSINDKMQSFLIKAVVSYFLLIAILIITIPTVALPIEGLKMILIQGSADMSLLFSCYLSYLTVILPLSAWHCIIVLAWILWYVLGFFITICSKKLGTK